MLLLTRSVGTSMVDPSGQAKLYASKHARGLSIHQKLLGLILLLVSGVVVLLAVYLPSREIASMRAALDAKAMTYARLVAKEVAPAVAFDDQETAREVFDSIAEDPDVESVALVGANGLVLGVRGSPTPALLERTATPASRTLRVAKDRVSVVAPVVSLEGPRGTLVIELSLRGLVREQRSVQRNALMIGLFALLLGSVGASLIAVSLGKRLRAIGSVAEAVAAGDLERPPVEVAGRVDEIGLVALAFNAMLAHIRELVAQIQKSALDEQRRLESLVSERTRDLDQRNADLKRVLDHVGQGFVSLDRHAKMSRERSRVLGEWFGTGAERESFAELLQAVSPKLAAWFELGWQSLEEGFLPLEVCIDQLPRRASVGERELGFEYRPILEGDGGIKEVLVVVSDVTDSLRRSRAEADEREVTRLFTKLSADRPGFLDFLQEANALVTQITECLRVREDVLLKRALHTLKGNAALFGLETVADECHRLEDRLAEGAQLEGEDIEPLCRRWRELGDKVRALVEDQSEKIELDDDEYAEILGALEREVSHAELRRRVKAWRLEPAHARLTRIAAQASALAERLGKAPIRTEINANQVRVERRRWREFWAACAHVVRNAVDHGLETPEEREASGKPVPATLRLSTAVVGDRFQVEFADDGCGIDWTKVRAVARRLGLEAETQRDLEEVLFADGLSTKADVTAVSGRGVGLSAVRQACTRLGGRVEVESTPGRGTTFRFVWPAAAAYVPGQRAEVSVRPPHSTSAARIGARL